jgi:hypothetical protein
LAIVFSSFRASAFSRSSPAFSAPELRLEVLVADLLAWHDAPTAPWVQAPPLPLDVLPRDRLAEPEHISIFRLLTEDLLELRLRFVAPERDVDLLTSVKPRHIR